jgi:hypothetical protein
MISQQEEAMKEYSKEQIEHLQSNPYTFKVTKNKLYFTIEFKKEFWFRYQAGHAPKRIISDLGYDVSILHQKQIDSLVQRIKRQSLSGEDFTEGEVRKNRLPIKSSLDFEATPQSLERMQNEILYLRQEVEYLKKIVKCDLTKHGQHL